MTRDAFVLTLHRRLAGVWDADTSASPERWMPSRPSIGQCAVTALVVQDLRGGDLMRRTVNGESHYFNQMSFTPFELWDLTLDQFDPPYVLGLPEVRSRDYVLGFDETRKRYELLRDRLGLDQP